MTNKPYGTLYIGVTSDIARRVNENRHGLVPGFTKRYGLKHLMYLEVFDYIDQAIQREKCLKRWKRDWKIDLINYHNPDCNDLSQTFFPEIV